MPAANSDTYTGRTGRPVHAGKIDSQTSAPPPPPPPPPPGPGVTLTTVSLDSKSTSAQTLVPTTFGQPFVAGHWNPTTHNLFARIGATPVPVQADEIALHVDGSVRFAVLSAELPTLAANETKVLELYTDAAAPQAAPTLVVPADWNLKAEALIHRNQVTLLRFTDRVTSGYTAGETVTLTLTYGEVVETFVLTILAAWTSASALTSGTNVAAQMGKLIRETSVLFESVRPGSSYEYTRLRLKDRAGGAFTVAVSYAGTAVITVSNEFEYGGPPVPYEVNFRAPLLAAVAAANAGTQPEVMRRMHGRVATEFVIVQPFAQAGGSQVHPHLTARACIRLYRGGAIIKTDVSFELTHLFVPNQRQVTYSLRLLNNGTSLFYEPPFAHYYSSRWRKAVWHGTQPAVRFRHAMPYFINSRACFPHDVSLTVPESSLASFHNDMLAKRAAQAPTKGPMAWLNLQPLMGTTGGRNDIGPVPTWHSMYMISQDDRALEVMLANADAAGSAPIHFRDESTDKIVECETYPSFSLNLSSKPVPLPVNRPDPTDWGPDSEHQASFAYVPYLITGDYYYLEETQFWASFSLVKMPTGYRGFEKGLVRQQTVRAQAWTLRNICDAARITPETHPLKGALQRIKQHNLDWYADNYRVGTSNPTISPLGSLAHDSVSTAPWQCDYFASVMALQAMNNEVGARSTLDFIARYNVQRVISPEFCHRKAAGYYFRTASNPEKVLFTSLSQVYEYHFVDVPLSSCSTTTVNGSPDGVFTYAAILQGTLGILAHAGVSGAAEAYALYRPLVTAKLANNPIWAYAPPTP